MRPHDTAQLPSQGPSLRHRVAQRRKHPDARTSWSTAWKNSTLACRPDAGKRAPPLRRWPAVSESPRLLWLRLGPRAAFSSAPPAGAVNNGRPTPGGRALGGLLLRTRAQGEPWALPGSPTRGRLAAPSPAPADGLDGTRFRVNVSSVAPAADMVLWGEA